MNSARLVGNEYVEFCSINWSFKFVQIYYRISLTDVQERFPPQKQISS